MGERFEVTRHPKAGGAKQQTFTRKGLAFAYAKKHVGADLNGSIAIERQVGEDTSWSRTDTWLFFRDGNVEHSRN